jgi:hypothetical protein
LRSAAARGAAAERKRSSKKKKPMNMGENGDAAAKPCDEKLSYLTSRCLLGSCE